MAEIVIDIDVKGGNNVEKAVNSFTKLKSELKAAKGELANFELGTKGFADAQKKIQELQDSLGDLADATKIQGNGVERLGASFGLLKESLGSADLDKAKLAFKGLGAAMDAIPIFLIIEGLKFLWDNLDKVKEILFKIFPALDNVSESTKALEKAQAKQIESSKHLEIQLNAEIEIMKLQGKSLEEIFEKEKELILIKIEALKQDNLIQSAKIRDVAANDSLFESLGRIGIAIQRNTGDKAGADLAEKGLTQNKIERAKEFADKIKENNLAIEQSQASLDILEAKFAKDKKDRGVKSVEDKKKTNDELKKLQEDYNASLNEIEKEALAQRIKETEERIKLINSELAAYELSEKNKVTLRDAANKANSDNFQKANADFQVAQKTQEQKEFDDLNKKSKDRKDAINNIYLAEVAAAGDDEGLIQEAERKKNELKKKEEEDYQAAVTEISKRGELKRVQDGIAIAQSGFQAAQGLSDAIFSIKLANVKKGSKEEENAARKQFQVNKALSISTAIMQGAQSVLAITAVPDFTLGVASAIRIAAVAATTVATVAKIAATQFGSAGGGGASAPAAAGNGGGQEAPAVANFVQPKLETVGSQNQAQGGTQGQPIVKAFVVTQDITDSQNKEKIIEANTSF